ncbi:MAG: oligosaccharide flippase family protein [Candidatus Latescibacterota bacterium]
MKAGAGTARVIRGMTSMGGSTLVAMVCSFAGVSLAARLVPKEELGVYFLMLAVVYLLTVAGNLGIPLAAVRFVAGAATPEERGKTVDTLVTLRLASVACLAALALVAKPLLLRFFTSGMLDELFAYVPLIFALTLVENTLGSVMQGCQQYRLIALLQVTGGVLGVVLTAVFLVGYHLGVHGLVLANLVGSGVGILLRLWLLPVRIHLCVDLEVVRRVWRFGLPLQGNEVLNFLIQRVDVLVLARLADPVGIAYLEVAGKVPSSLRRVYSSLQSVYFPHMSQLLAAGRKAEGERTVNEFLRVVAFAACLGALCVLLFQRQIVVALFSREYLASAPALGLLMVVLAVSACNQILDTGFVAAGRSAFLLVVNLVTAVVGVTANLGLIPVLGFLGAAWARLLADLASNPFSVACLRRQGIRVELGRYLRPLAYLGVCVAIDRLAGVESLAAKGLIILLYLGLCRASSLIRGGDLQVALGSLRPAPRQAVLEP